MHGTGVCDFCGKSSDNMMPSFWSDKTRWFCDVDCLGRFKSVALGSQYADEALDGPPGTAKKILEKLKTKDRK